ncbi:LytTR family DNA-binding domain-containing protein [Lactiplantibacillus songbeiensis]|uniref:LytTR family DNA-binding domain-containing protein n=1 Tax=Lactiplantibacillus songbeiensis TaxID=2559920 RepID=A0ABW4BW91_9LACO|nr:LytTR family DNA-binding domain-containing protein [Lactiplantibacillus songbeiensis]
MGRLQLHIQVDPQVTEPTLTLHVPNAEAASVELVEALKKIGQPPATLTVSQRGQTIQLPLTTILFFEADGHVVRVHTTTAVYTTTTRLYQLAEALPAAFLRVSKSAIVNTTAISALTKSLTGNLIRLQDSPKQLYASRRYYKQINHARLKPDACENHTPWHGDHNLLRYSVSLRIGLIR